MKTHYLKIPPFIALLIVVIFLLSCNKGVNNSKDIQSVKTKTIDLANQNNTLIADYTTGEIQLHQSDTILETLYLSNSWKSLSSALKQSVNKQSAKEILYDNGINNIIRV